MEEEEERSRHASRDSSVRLRGGGWSRGFLTKTSTKKKKEVKKKKEEEEEEEEERSSLHRRAEGHEKREGGERRDEGGTSMAAALPSSSSSKDGKTTSDESRTTTTKAVSFSGDDTVREIPRIGTSRVPPRPASSTSSSRRAKFDPATGNRPTTTFSSGDDGDDNVGPVAAPSLAVPFEEDDVFRGVVRERTTAADYVEAARGSGVGKERLSRFARERLQRGSRS
ncbi:hypothetical protein ACHAW5_004312 [Stephanodiscus triporus]|uniref:ADP-ribosylation factor-like protein 6-interacting protein 4 n=1 Tax=Stephanodiscus triporus TaxID=2934178 RepID=A0ABD3QIC3_9STRA